MSLACDHAARCPGCPLLDRSADEQRAEKTARVAGALALHPALTGLVVRPATLAEPDHAYRTRAKWVVEDGRIGLYAREGHEVLDLPRCRVVRPELARATDAVRARLRVDASLARALVALDLRSARDAGRARVLATLVLRADAVPKRGALLEIADALLDDGAIAGVAVSTRDPRSPRVLGETPVHLAGDAEAWDETGRSRTLATFGAFVQAHAGQAARIHDALVDVVRSLGPAPRVLDLYGGSGSIGLALARAGAKVTLVESYAPAVALADRAAKDAGLSLVARGGDAAAFGEERFDLVVANPPRRGLAPRLRQLLPRLASRVAIVSCDPGTLARDLAHLAWLGLRADALSPFDMIPQTREVETLALLAPGDAPPLSVLHEDRDVVVVDKPAFLPTTPQGEHDTSLFALVRRLRGAEKAVPLHRLDLGTSGVCVFVKSQGKVAAWQAALAGAEKTYLAWVKGVVSARGVVQRPLRESGKMLPSRTRYERREVVAKHSLVAATIDTGRQHQIRRHFEGIGHPVLGDERYGHAPTNVFADATFGLDRTFLHCERLVIVPPGASAPVTVEAPLAGDLVAVMDRARRGG